MKKYTFTLYVAGHTSRSQQAIANLRRVCEEAFPSGQYELRIVDVLECPELAETAKILATPTLIKELPPPPRRIIGDLSDTRQVLSWIELQWRPEQQKEETA